MPSTELLLTITISSVLGSLFCLCSITAWLACRRVSFLRRRARARAAALLRLGLATNANVLEPASIAGVNAEPYFADRDEECALDAEIAAAEEAVQAPDLQGLSRVLDALVNDAATLNPLFAILFIGAMAPLVAIIYLVKLFVALLRAVARAIALAVEAVFDAAFAAYTVVLRAAVSAARYLVISTRAYNLNTSACTSCVRNLSQKGAFVCGCLNNTCSVRATRFEAWCVDIRAEMMRADARARGIIVAESATGSSESETGAPRDSPGGARTVSAAPTTPTTSPSRARVSPRSPRPAAAAVAPAAAAQTRTVTSLISSALRRAWTDDDDDIDTARAPGRRNGRGDGGGGATNNDVASCSGGGTSGDSAQRSPTRSQRRPRWSPDDGRWVEEVSDGEEGSVGAARNNASGGVGGRGSSRSSGDGATGRNPSPRASTSVGAAAESPRAGGSTAASNLHDAVADPRIPPRLLLQLRASSADDPAVELPSRNASLEIAAYSSSLTLTSSRGTADPGSVGSGGSRAAALAPKSPDAGGSSSPSIASMRAVRGLR